MIVSSASLKSALQLRKPDENLIVRGREKTPADHDMGVDLGWAWQIKLDRGWIILGKRAAKLAFGEAR